MKEADARSTIAAAPPVQATPEPPISHARAAPDVRLRHLAEEIEAHAADLRREAERLRSAGGNGEGDDGSVEDRRAVADLYEARAKDWQAQAVLVRLARFILREETR